MENQAMALLESGKRLTADEEVIVFRRTMFFLQYEQLPLECTDAENLLPVYINLANCNHEFFPLLS